MRYCLTIIFALFGFMLSAQQKHESDGIIPLAGLSKYIENHSSSVTWIGSGHFCYAPESGEEERTFYLVDTKTWKPVKMFDNEEFVSKVNELSQCGMTVRNLRPGLFEFDPKNPGSVRFSYKGNHFRYDVRKQELTKADEPREKDRRRPFAKEWHKSFTADSSCYVTAKGHDLWAFTGNDSVRLTTDGERYFSWATGGKKELDPEKYTGAIGQWVGKSRKRLIIREDWRSVGTLTIVNSLAEPRPVAETYKFPMPGDTGVVRYDVMLFDADRSQVSRIDGMDRFKDQQIKMSLLRHVPCTDRYAWLLRVSRTCDTLDLCRVDVTDGSVRTIISEVCKPHYNEQLFSFHVINEGNEILWWSERSGKGRWYLYDGEGNLKNALTDEDFVSARIIKIDTLDRKVIFEGYGREKGINPHYRFYYEAGLDGKSSVRLLTPGNGNHEIKFSPGFRYIEDTWSRMDCAPMHQIVDRKGNVRFRMEDADVSTLIEKGWRYPDVVKVKAADGVTDLYGVVYTPLNIEEGRKYPIISSVYPGPQDDQVPQSFYLDENDNQSLAQRGFVVINFAYRGSGPYRGRDFHSYGYGNLRDYPLDDDYAVVRQIAEMYPFADSTRVGIYGHSGGGFMTVAAMLERPDFYKVGVAASGNHDNNIYRQQWAETFHGVQNNGGCFSCEVPTNIEKAGNLKGKLLLMTGDVDNNVHPAGTYRLVNALIKKKKKFDMMVFPGVDHAMGGEYYVNLIHDYFTDHLK